MIITCPNCKKKFKIDAYWSLQPKEYFYKYYPKNFKFKEILWGIEPTRFLNLKPYNDRISEKILNSGNVGRSSIKSKIGHLFSKDINSATYFYKLRTMCNNLSYVDYAGMKGNAYINEDYSEYLINIEKSKEGHMNVNYNFLVKLYSELNADQKLKFNKTLQISGSNISKAV